MKDNEAVVLLGFAENYKFVIQDKVKSFHWNQQSCSILLVVIHFSSNSILSEKSFCSISDDLNRGISFIYHVMKEMISVIKQSIPASINKIGTFHIKCTQKNLICTVTLVDFANNLHMCRAL